MKKVLSILIILLVTTSCTSSKVSLKSDSLSSDEINSQKILGHWGEGDSPYGISAFQKGGVYKAWMYKSSKKEKLIIEMEAKWWIKDGQLYNELTEIYPPLPGFEIGRIVIDQIVDISENEMTLIDEEGQKYKNIRLK